MRTTLVVILIGKIMFGFAQESQKTIDSLKYAIAHAKPDTTKAKALYRLAEFYINSQPDSSYYYSSKCLKLVKEINWDKGIGAVESCFGRIYSNKGDNKEALKHYEISLQKAIKIDFKPNIISSLINIGSAYQMMSDLVKATEYIEKALKIAKETNNARLTAFCYSNLSDIFFAHQDIEKSLSYNQIALGYALQSDDLNEVGSIYMKIAGVYLSQNKLPLAEKNYKNALRMYRKTNNRFGEAQVLSNYALIFENEIGKQKKLYYLLKANEIYNQVNPKSINSITNMGNIGGTYAGIAIIDQSLSKTKTLITANQKDSLLKKAVSYLNKAILYSKEVNDMDDLSYFSDNLAQVQEYQGDYKNALKNFKISKNIDDSLYSQKAKNKIAKLESQKDLDKKDLEIADNRSKMKQLWIYGLIAIIIIVLIAGLVVFKYRLKQLRLKNELEKNAAENRAKELTHKNKLTEIELKAIRSQMNPHFIFNVLNSIESYVIENDSKTASRLIQKFASLSRLILENSTQSLVSAEKEFKALQLYTELEAIRFNHHFSYNFELKNRSPLKEIMMPPMLIQPLIENSIHHGLKNQKDKKNHILIKIEEIDKELTFTVKDNGIGLKEAAKLKSNHLFKEQSFGLKGIKERLKIMEHFNRSGNIDIYEEENLQGTIAVLTLPLILKKINF
ncbi:tetratricopeptide repeat protein [Pedobacter sp. SD-b]|uniref:Tetratricopeptide repeat protein n=1 Tax=Pedobacter segetis TaxID=2793069 RepID=A0ABS1BFU3_9SPHI|nr:tetratricopeptide repeat protein [Pedobacter segetis]MBK0381742.1 tetratricopeptide repeat protein [Pedobacter segetis]